MPEMNETLQAATTAIRARFGAEVQEFRGEVSLVLAPEQFIAAAQHLKENHGFNVLLDITAVDYWPQQSPRFHVIYQLYNIDNYDLLRLRVPLDGNAPKLSTLENVYSNANWKEREVWDLFGVKFEGHSDLRRIMMPEDWVGHPLRKDYPLGYEEVQHSFNYEEIEQRKPYSKGLR